MRPIRPVLLAGAVLLAACLPCAAQDGQASTCTTQPYPSTQPVATTQKAPATQPDGWFETCKKTKEQLAKMAGTEVCLLGMATNQAVLNGRSEGGDRSTFWWNLHVAQRLWQGAKLITDTRGGAGSGFQHLDGGMLNTNWTQCEPASLYVSQLYLQQKFLKDRLMVNAGKIDLGDYFDTNAYSNWSFLSYTLARNPTVPCAWHAIGAMARADLADWLYVEAGAADAQGAWTQTGLNTAFRDDARFVGMYELGLRPKFNGRPGNYRFMLWQDGRTVGRVDGSGNLSGDLGMALSFDQALTNKLGLFMRYGHTDERVQQASDYWSLGASFKGLLPRRPYDELALSVGQLVFGNDFRDVNHTTANETIFETFYRIRLTEWCSLSPDVQVLLNPGGRSDADVGVVVGLKLVFEF